MRILMTAIFAASMIIGMFVYLDHGDATKVKILSEDQREQLKDAMKPPKL